MNTSLIMPTRFDTVNPMIGQLGWYNAIFSSRRLQGTGTFCQCGLGYFCVQSCQRSFYKVILECLFREVDLK